MNHETKEVIEKKAFLALDMLSHHALGLWELGVKGGKLNETLQRIQASLNECRRINESD